MSLAREKTGNELVDGVFCSLAIHPVYSELLSTADFYQVQVEALLFGITQELTHALLKLYTVTSVSCMPDVIAKFTDLLPIKAQHEVLSANRIFDVQEAGILSNKWRIVNRTVSRHLGLDS